MRGETTAFPSHSSISTVKEEENEDETGSSIVVASRTPAVRKTDGNSQSKFGSSSSSSSATVGGEGGAAGGNAGLMNFFVQSASSVATGWKNRGWVSSSSSSTTLAATSTNAAATAVTTTTTTTITPSVNKTDEKPSQEETSKTTAPAVLSSASFESGRDWLSQNLSKGSTAASRMWSTRMGMGMGSIGEVAGGGGGGAIVGNNNNNSSSYSSKSLLFGGEALNVLDEDQAHYPHQAPYPFHPQQAAVSVGCLALFRSIFCPIPNGLALQQQQQRPRGISTGSESDSDPPPLFKKRRGKMRAPFMWRVLHTPHHGTVQNGDIISNGSNEASKNTMDAMLRHFFFSQFSREEIILLLSQMSNSKFDARQPLVVEGQNLTHCFFIESGKVDIFQCGRYVETKSAGEYFCDEALVVENAKSEITAVAAAPFGNNNNNSNSSSNNSSNDPSAVSCWLLDRPTYRAVASQHAVRNIDNIIALLAEVFRSLPPHLQQKLAEKLVPITYDPHELIIEEGGVQKVHALYIVQQGTVHVTKGYGAEFKWLATLEQGSYFGEAAVLCPNQPRIATVEAGADGVVCLCLQLEDSRENDEEDVVNENDDGKENGDSEEEEKKANKKKKNNKRRNEEWEFLPALTAILETNLRVRVMRSAFPWLRSIPDEIIERLAQEFKGYDFEEGEYVTTRGISAGLSSSRRRGRKSGDFSSSSDKKSPTREKRENSNNGVNLAEEIMMNGLKPKAPRTIASEDQEENGGGGGGDDEECVIIVAGSVLLIEDVNFNEESATGGDENGAAAGAPLSSSSRRRRSSGQSATKQLQRSRTVVAGGFIGTLHAPWERNQTQYVSQQEKADEENSVERRKSMPSDADDNISSTRRKSLESQHILPMSSPSRNGMRRGSLDGTTASAIAPNTSTSTSSILSAAKTRSNLAVDVGRNASSTASSLSVARSSPRPPRLIAAEACKVAIARRKVLEALAHTLIMSYGSGDDSTITTTTSSQQHSQQQNQQPNLSLSRNDSSNASVGSSTSSSLNIASGDEVVDHPNVTSSAAARSSSVECVVRDFSRASDVVGIATPRLHVTADDLEEIGLLGHGSFGKVKLVKHIHSGQMFALKQLNKSKIASRKLQKYANDERRVMMMLDSHPFIVHLHCAFTDFNHLCLVLELVSGIDLHDRLLQVGGRIPISAAKLYFSMMCLALEYIHSKKIVYRDLKPENLVIDSDGFLKMIDFGMSLVVKGRTFTTCGTSEYMASEILLGRGYTRAVDLWALGVTLFEMIVGYTPFNPGGKCNEMTVCKNIVCGVFDDPPPELLAKIEREEMDDNNKNEKKDKSKEENNNNNNKSKAAAENNNLHDDPSSPPAWLDLVRRLLTADPDARLGMGGSVGRDSHLGRGSAIILSKGFSDIWNHPFLADVDRMALLHRQIVPPFIPPNVDIAAVAQRRAKRSSPPSPVFNGDNAQFAEWDQTSNGLRQISA